MSHSETRISNERLADLLTAETMLVVTVGEFRSILTEIQALRSTLVDTDHLDAAIRLTKQIEGVFYHDHPGGALQVRAKVQLILAGALAHPLPNPSPSDGEVSEAATLDEKALAAAVCAAAAEAQDETNGKPAGNIVAIGCEENGYNDPVDAAASFITSMARAAVSAYLETLQSKRGQP